MRLLAPAKPAAPPPPPPPPEPLVVPGIVVVDTADQHGLSAAVAQARLKNLADEARGRSGLQLDLSWKLYRRKGPG